MMVKTSSTSKDRGLPQESKSKKESNANNVRKDAQNTDPNSSKDSNQIIIDFLLARMSVFRDLVELRGLVCCFSPFQIPHIRIAK